MAQRAGTVQNSKSPKKRAPKMRGLWLRGNIYWFRPPQRNGYRPVPFSLETANENDAIEKALAWLRTPALRDVGRWEAEIEIYLRERTEDRKLSPMVIASRRYILKSFGTKYNVRLPSEVAASMVQAWYDALSRGDFAERTCEDYVAQLRAFLGWLVAEKKLGSNPAREIRMRRVMKVAKKDFVDRAGVRRCLAMARLETRRARVVYDRTRGHCRQSGDPRSQRYAAEELQRAREMEFLLYLGFDAGLRKNEMVEARPEWFSKVSLNVSKTATFTPKDRDERSVPLTRRFRRFLQREYRKLPGPWVIAPEKVKSPKAKYRYDPKKKFQLFFERCQAAAGEGRHAMLSVKGRRPNIHMLRHSFASNRLIGAPDANGVVRKADPFRVAEWMSISMDMLQFHYGHLLEDDPEVNYGV